MTFLDWLSDPFKGLSDLQLGDEKVTLNHLAHLFNICRIPLLKATFGFTTGIFEGLLDFKPQLRELGKRNHKIKKWDFQLKSKKWTSNK